jgi:hypothetical protein
MVEMRQSNSIVETALGGSAGDVRFLIQSGGSLAMHGLLVMQTGHQTDTEMTLTIAQNGQQTHANG